MLNVTTNGYTVAIADASMDAVEWALLRLRSVSRRSALELVKPDQVFAIQQRHPHAPLAGQHHVPDHLA